jgi:hypothetical protein
MHTQEHTHFLFQSLFLQGKNPEGAVTCVWVLIQGELEACKQVLPGFIKAHSTDCGASQYFAGDQGGTHHFPFVLFVVEIFLCFLEKQRFPTKPGRKSMEVPAQPTVTGMEAGNKA